MQRRNFLKNSAAVVLPALLNGFTIRAFGSNNFLNSMLQYADPGSDRVLVLVQLFGGNDGLNTIIPLSDYRNYYHARENIAIPESKVLRIKGKPSIGFHPSIPAFRNLFEEGKLAVLQSIGYPSPDFSHFRSSDIWMSASNATQSLNTGWTGRYLNHLYPQYPAGYPNEKMKDPLAIQIGTATSFVFQGNQSPMAINVADPENAYSLVNGFNDTAPMTNGGRELDFVRVVAEQSQVYSQVIKKVAGRVSKQFEYPAGNSLANQLKVVARLIKGGLGTKVYMVSFDGFDTHAQQVNANDTTTGRHADLLKTVSEAISAFQSDLEFLQIQDRVMGMTFSEFGRRIRSNNSLGTDHGAAAPMFIFGSKVKGGIYGKDIILPPNVTSEDNLAMETDFRSVYTTMLKNWMQLPEKAIDDVMLAKFKTLEFI